MLQLAHGGAQLAGLAGQGLARRLGHRRLAVSAGLVKKLRRKATEVAKQVRAEADGGR